MKLYYSPGACSLAPHLVAIELGIPLALVKVDNKTKTIRKEGDYWEINPKGYVPTLELDNGERLTENPVVLTYLAELKPAGRLLPEHGDFTRIRVHEMLSYLTSEMHKTYGPLFKTDTPQPVREERIRYLKKVYSLIDKQLEGRKYLFGDQFTIADAYLFVMTRWAEGLKIDLGEFANLAAFQKRVAELPSVRKAMIEEGLIKEKDPGTAKVA